MPNIPFPDVPQLPGVPSLPRSPQFPPLAQVAMGLIQGLLWQVFQVDTRWGIWDSFGDPLADPAKFTGLAGMTLDAMGIGSTLSTNAICYSKETRVSQFPLERGSFASYNKVEMPASPVVTLCLTGSEDDRAFFLLAIDDACKSTELFSVVTPEVTYIDYSIERYNYERRSSKGCTLLVVELTLAEIRQVSAQYSQIERPKTPSASPQVDSGKVQAQPAQQSSLKSLATKVGL